MMDLSDVLVGADMPKRPVTPDMDRIMEIVLEMKAITSENQADPQEFERKWREHIARFIDFDSLTYQAFQVAFSIMNIRNGRDFIDMRRDGRKNERFIGTIQGFFDGFLLGAEFQQRGGHRD